MSFNDKVKSFFELYANLGVTCIPLISKTKRPALQKGQLEAVYNRKLTITKEKFDKCNNCNIGIVAGISKLVVFDADNQYTVEFFESLKNFIHTATVQTRRGRHYYYKINNTDELKKTNFVLKANPKDKKSDDLIHLDMQGGNSYVVAPPSIVANDKNPEDESLHEYRFIEGYDESNNFLEIIEVNKEWLDKITTEIKTKLKILELEINPDSQKLMGKLKKKKTKFKKVDKM